MYNIEPLLMNVDAAISRASLYYAGRYIKQAAYFKTYNKDIFDDERRSLPDVKVRELTLEIISAVEGYVGFPATEFPLPLAIDILDVVTAIEDGLGPPPTEGELNAASSFIRDIAKPSIGRR